MRRAGGQDARVPGAFAGFGPQALGFLRALAFHQTKAWFDENRAIYDDEIKTPLLALLADLTAEFGRLGLPLRGDARSVFRLNRDVRFSKDKRPYKTNSGAVLSRDGTKRTQGFLYIHLDPEGCFAAAGFWQPEPEALLSLRRAIRDRGAAFRTAAKALRKAGLELGDGDPLTRLPKGFEDVADADLAAGIRSRSLVVRRPIDAEAIHQPALASDLARFGREAAPLLRFGWGVLGAEIN